VSISNKDCSSDGLYRLQSPIASLYDSRLAMGITCGERRLNSRSSCLPTHQITCEYLCRSEITRRSKKKVQFRRSENWDFKRDLVMQTSACPDRQAARCASLNIPSSSCLAIRSYRKSRCVSSGVGSSGSTCSSEFVYQNSLSNGYGGGSLAFDGAHDPLDEAVTLPHVSVSKRSSFSEEACPFLDRDGDGSDLTSLPSTPSNLEDAESHRSYSTFRGIDLTLPFQATPTNRRALTADTPTPLTRASPARGAFPFSQQDRHVTSLSPLSLRRQAHGLRSPQRADSGSSSVRQRSGSATPDRFIPIRSNSARDTFQLNKPAHLLSADEKISRRRSLGHDPFSRHLRSTARHQRGTRSAHGTHSIGPRAYALGPNHVFPLQRGSPMTPTAPRQASAGAVWNIGGSAALGDSVTAVSDGRGGLLGSGTNAPLYTSNFFQRTDPLSELDLHEKRLALALDIDQASRILEMPLLPSSPCSPPVSLANSLSRAPLPEVQSAIVWRDSEWVKDGSTISSRSGTSMLCEVAEHRYRP